MNKRLLILVFLVFSSSAFSFQGNSWELQNGELQLTQLNSEDIKATKYWTFIHDLLPKAILDKYVKVFRLWSDGPEEDLAGFTPLNWQNSEWELDIDTLDFRLNSTDEVRQIDIRHTAIHEFGHLLTLNPDQVTPTEDEYEDESKGYLTYEGYAGSNSYLGLFVKEFWEDHLLPEWDEIEAIRNENRKYKQLEKFYYQHEEYFLSGYSSESPEEDIAEAWTFFILSDRPKTDEYRLKKIEFFYQFPELVQMRTEIRNNIEFIPKDFLSYFKAYLEDF